VVVSDLSGSCEYTLAAQPTVEVAGKGPLAAGGYWGPVGCATMFGDPAKGDELAAFTVGNQPWVLGAGTQDPSGDTAPSPDQYQVFLAKGTLAQFRSLTDANQPPGDQYPMTATDAADGAIAIALGGAAQGQVITLTCTTEVGRIGGIGVS
jgi:hypothetical protein